MMLCVYNTQTVGCQWRSGKSMSQSVELLWKCVCVKVLSCSEKVNLKLEPWCWDAVRMWTFSEWRFLFWVREFLSWVRALSCSWGCAELIQLTLVLFVRCELFMLNLRAEICFLDLTVLMKRPIKRFRSWRGKRQFGSGLRLWSGINQGPPQPAQNNVPGL